MTILIINLCAKKCVTKTYVSNLMHFQGKIVHFFLKNEPLRSKSVKRYAFTTFNINMKVPGKSQKIYPMNLSG